MKIVIGNHNYSSWSLRAWLLLRQAGLAFETIRVPLYAPGFSAQIKHYHPAGKVPVLIDNDQTIWDSLAICEYLNEQYLEDSAWPVDKVSRAHARSSCAEMHSSFIALRSEMPMNCRRIIEGFQVSEAAQQDIDRIIELWSEALTLSNSDRFLYGEFSIADAFYAPVAFRFASYQVELPQQLQAYQQRLLQLPACQEWLQLAQQESEVIEEEEV